MGVYGTSRHITFTRLHAGAHAVAALDRSRKGVCFDFTHEKYYVVCRISRRPSSSALLTFDKRISIVKVIDR